jgi:hypothetical protein
MAISVAATSSGVCIASRHLRFGRTCGSAWNKDPVFGVIGIQSGPPDGESTVASLGDTGARSGMLVVETIAKIGRAYFAQNKPIKTICREFRVSRRVVRKVIRSQVTEFRYQRSRQPAAGSRGRGLIRGRDQLDGLLLENERAHAAGTGSLLTQRWRKPDLNHRYRAIRSRFRKGSCRLCLIPRPTEEPANESWYHDDAGLALRD